MKKTAILVFALIFSITFATKSFAQSKNANEPKGHKVYIDYNKSVSDMIDAGNYDKVENEDLGLRKVEIVKRASGVLEMYVFSTQELFGKRVEATSDEVLGALEQKGFRSVELTELLAFGSSFPEKLKMRHTYFIALGSTFDCVAMNKFHTHYPCVIGTMYLDSLLSKISSDSGLWLRAWGLENRRWGSDFLFLAIRKQ